MNALGNWIAESDARELAQWLLANVPGLPPILQTIHLLSICALMASAVMLDLRILGLALPSQNLVELRERVEAWTWASLLGVFSSGIWFFLARPNRYVSNPVFQIKFALLIPAIMLSFFLYKGLRARASESVPLSKWFTIAALLSLVLWCGVVLAGRWIAYSEYLFWPD